MVVMRYPSKYWIEISIQAYVIPIPDQILGATSLSLSHVPKFLFLLNLTMYKLSTFVFVGYMYDSRRGQNSSLEPSLG